MKYLASCSFGKDSIAAIITHLQNGGGIDEAVYCRIMFDDTLSAELPEHEEWIHNVAIPKLETEWGVKTTIVQAEKNYMDFFHQKYKRGQLAGKIYGFPLLRGPWCNSRLKTNPIHAYLKRQKYCKQIIGIAVDEPSRIKDSPDLIYPLVEKNITGDNAFKICKNHGLLSPAYDNQTRRLGCWFCHNQQIGELRKLRKNYPDRWATLLELDKESLRTFKPDWTVTQLDKRFELEDRQMTLV